MTRTVRGEQGFTIIEALMAAFILAVGVGATMSLFVTANTTTNKTRDREAAVALTRELIEAARGVPYDRLSTETLRAELSRQPGLDGVSGGEYLIARRGALFRVEGTACVMDDVNDGAGTKFTTEAFCPDAARAGTTTRVDRNPEDYKRVTLTISWKPQAGARQSLTQTSVINNPGSSTGPAIRSLTPRSPTTLPVLTQPSDGTLYFNATTSSQPKTINWLLDGTPQANAPTNAGGGVSWNFSWNIASVDDGSYLVSAEAFNQYGVSGPSRSLTVQLNRYRPRTPAGAGGGRSLLHSNVVDIQWNANTEKDIVGYTVTRSDGTTICAMSRSTVCRDDAAPPGGGPKYRISAWDHAPDGSLRASAVPAEVTISESNKRPFVPFSVTGTFNSAGYVELKWHRPAPEDPDPGDSVLFYRVYRDGVSVSSRYDQWYSIESQPIYRDYNLGGTSHTYRITAVDRFYGESTLTEPLTVGPS